MPNLGIWARNFQKQMINQKSAYSIIYLDQRSYEISKISKTKVRFEICTFEKGYGENFVKMRDMI